MVIDGGQVVCYLHLLVLAIVVHAELRQQASHVLRYFVQSVKLLFVLHKHIRIYFVDKHFKSYLRVYFVRYLYYFKQFVASHVFVLLVSVDHVDKRTTVLQSRYVLRVLLLEVFSAWEIFYIKLNVRVVVDAYYPQLII